MKDNQWSGDRYNNSFLCRMKAQLVPSTRYLGVSKAPGVFSYLWKHHATVHVYLSIDVGRAVNVGLIDRPHPAYPKSDVRASRHFVNSFVGGRLFLTPHRKPRTT